jgi:ferrous iron transport protein A
VLSELRVGQRGEVLGVEGADDVSLRLMEMGLTPGVDLEVIGAAPLGDPIELSVRGYRLSVRRSEARRVTVRVY